MLGAIGRIFGGFKKSAEAAERRVRKNRRWAKIGSHKLFKRENRITLLFTAFSRWSAGVGHVLQLETHQKCRAAKACPEPDFR